MMTCRELADLLIDYVSGELTAEQRQRLDDHLLLCPPCVVYLETYKVTITLTRRLADVPLPPVLAEKLRKVLAEAAREQGGDCGRT
jgi:anti-sigma factor RsiW